MRRGAAAALAPAAVAMSAAPASLNGKQLERSIVMVGMMGAGKSAIGRRLAQRLGLPFTDADAEIERAAGCTIADIFERHGEAAFRDGERRVIARLLEGPIGVLATGGGAFMDAETRARIKRRAITVWLKADLDTLVERVVRRGHRPLLKDGDPREILTRLMAARDPVYAEADITVETGHAPTSATVERVIEALAALRPRAKAERRA
jgi:shikimate kinase